MTFFSPNNAIAVVVFIQPSRAPRRRSQLSPVTDMLHGGCQGGSEYKHENIPIVDELSVKILKEFYQA